MHYGVGCGQFAHALLSINSEPQHAVFVDVRGNIEKMDSNIVLSPKGPPLDIKVVCLPLSLSQPDH